MAKISILIPVYNVEKYLEKCLQSVINQTEKDIEIICVDDVSTDGSLEILKRYQSVDARIKVICHTENQGICKTRKDAVLVAEGEYIMFLDSDDYLSIETCETLYNAIKKSDVDVLQFGTELLYDENVSQELVDWVEHFMEPSEEYINGVALLRECFVSGKLNCNLVNKIWRSSCCKQGMEYLDDGKYISAEDRYICFLILYFAHSYIGIKNKFYHYRLAVGVTGGMVLDLTRFEKRCKGAVVSVKVKEFLEKTNSYNQYEDVYQHFYNDILYDCADCWYRKLEKADQPRGYQILLEHWNAGEIIGALARTFFEEQKQIESSIYPKKNIAVYYRYVGYKEMDCILEKYIRYIQDMGHEVLLITDADASEAGDGYLGCALIYLPAATDANWDQYVCRSRKLTELICEYNISELYYLSPTSHVMTLDKIVIVSCNVAVHMVMDEYVLDYANTTKSTMQEEISRLSMQLEEELQKQKELIIQNDHIENELSETQTELKNKIDELTDTQRRLQEIEEAYSGKIYRIIKRIEIIFRKIAAKMK